MHDWLQVGNRIIHNRLHVRIEHVQPSRCREEFLERRKSNDIRKAEAKARGETVDLKRQPAGPKGGFVLDSSTLETVTPIPYDVVHGLHSNMYYFIDEYRVYSWTRLHFGCDVHFLARGFGALIPSGCVTTLKEPQTVTAVNLLTRIECNDGWFMDKHGVYWVLGGYCWVSR